MTLELKRINIFPSKAAWLETKPETVEFYCDDELVFEGPPGSDIDANIEGFTTCLELLGKDFNVTIEEEF